MGTRVRWGPARHDNHEGQRMTPGAPTDGARSRLPGHRGPTEAGTTLKDSGKRRHSSKGLTCGSPLIDEAGATQRSRRSVPGWFVPLLRRHVFPSEWLSRTLQHSRHLICCATRRGPQALACGPLPHGSAILTATRGPRRPGSPGSVTLPYSQPLPRQSTRWARR